MSDEYLIYLRKSRQDRDIEASTGKFDTLERHRAALMALAAQRGFLVTGIYEEVVSGDTIAERPEMKKLLAAVETRKYAGVLVMEVARLARGNTTDQGIVAEAFQYSNTKIITPARDYDPGVEADEEYFEFELFMSRREYKMINRRQQRGRMASLYEGKYIAGTPPYGYEKRKIPKQKGYTLVEKAETADVVRRIFNTYVTTQKGSYSIALELNAEGIPAPGGGEWNAISVRDILRNPTYAGYVRWSYRPVVKSTENGVRSTSTPINKSPTIIKGVHEPIISDELYEKAKLILKSRAHLPIPRNREIKNPLAGLLFCSVCGRSMVQLPHGSKQGPMLACPTAGCYTVSSRTDAAEAALLASLRRWLDDYEVEQRDAPDAAVDEREKDIARKKAALSRLETQRNRLYDLLEQGVYSQEVFLERSRLLADKLEAARADLISAENNAVKVSDEESKRIAIVPLIKGVLSGYGNLCSPAEKNAMLKLVIDHAIYLKSTGGRWGESDMAIFVFPKLG